MGFSWVRNVVTLERIVVLVLGSDRTMGRFFLSGLAFPISLG